MRSAACPSQKGGMRPDLPLPARMCLSGSDDSCGIGANEQVCTLGDGDGALGVFAEGQAGHAESGGFFLDAARIGEDESGFAEEAEEIEIAERGGMSFSWGWFLMPARARRCCVRG